MTDIVKNEQETPLEATRTHVQVTPPVDILEGADEILVRADLPGVRTDALDLRLENGELTLEGRSEHGHEPRLYSRTFALPKSVEGESISADLKNGVLTIHLPRRAELKPRQISVQSK